MVDRGVFGSALRWMAVGRLAAQLVSWAATIFVLRLLRPEDYGLAAICTAVVGAVAIVSDFALSAGLVQARDLRHDQMRGVLGAVLLIALACTVAVWLAAPALGVFFDSPQVVLINPNGVAEPRSLTLRQAGRERSLDLNAWLEDGK